MARFRHRPDPVAITPRQGAGNKEWAVAFGYGDTLHTFDNYLTRTAAETKCDELNRRQAERHPGGSPYQVAHVDFAYAEGVAGWVVMLARHGRALAPHGTPYETLEDAEAACAELNRGRRADYEVFALAAPRPAYARGRR